MGRKLKLAVTAVSASMVIIRMRAQYLRDVTEKELQMERWIEFIVEKGHEDVLADSYSSEWEALTSRVQEKAAKHMYTARMDRERGPTSSGG